MTARDVAEAAVILGRSVVDEALADRARAMALYAARAGEVREAITGIRASLPDVPAAVEFAAGLPHEVRLALAGAWALDNSFEAALAEVGIVEEAPDA